MYIILYLHELCSVMLCQADGSSLVLDDSRGIDILGNVMESCPLLSPHPEHYGSMHNLGHVAIALCHDPDNRHLETFGVMGDAATAMRDPVFYRWHGFINDIFIKHKDRLPRYTVPQVSCFVGHQIM